MKHYTIFKNVVFIFCLTVSLQHLQAQQYDCSLKEPIITINFGTGKNVRSINSSDLLNYARVSNSCPTDGYYSFTPYTDDCFNGDWFALPEDHTANDANGNMMLVNASESGGIFLKTIISGLSGGARYQFGAWLMNICRIRGGCPPLPPNITILLKTSEGKTLAEYQTGQLLQRDAPRWKQYLGFFTMPAAETTLMLSMEDNTLGGCGNDFALDDITIRECVKIIAPATVEAKPPAVKQNPAAKPIIKKSKEITAPVSKGAEVKTIEKPEPNLPVPDRPAARQKPAILPPLPAILKARATPLIKQIETESGDIKIDLYDNGEIDGDTVSIYHNNELLVSNARLSQKPITFHISLDAAHPHHELVMVANNLGSIPPNTSLMIATAGSKRYEVFISSTEQKNAKVIFDLKE